MIIKYRNIFLFAIGVLYLAFSMNSCIDDRISHSPDLKLSFSKDSLLFDTIFTTIGSSTKQVKVYNRSEKNILISSMGLKMGSASPYRINVDGEQSASNRFEQIELRGNDSIFIFVEVNIEALPNDTPTLVEDEIEFLTNGNQQRINLLAFGQNMELLDHLVIQNDTLLTAQKPYFVYGDLVVDSAKTLTLSEGTKLFFYNNSSLVVYGNLIADGSFDKPITMRGHRTDEIFDSIPYNFVSNQWGGVLLLNKEGNHRMSHVNMNSGYVGVFFSNDDLNYRPTLEVNSCRIHNFLKYGLVVQNGDIMVNNSEISNTGSYSVYLKGGKHHFIHSTIANYFNNTNVRIQPSGREGEAALTLMEVDRSLPMESQFINCVIAGSNQNELDIFTHFEEDIHTFFKNSYIRKSKPEKDFAYFQNIRWWEANDTTIFKNHFFDIQDKVYYNFSLDSISPARDMADYDIAKKFPLDLSGKSRLEDGKPDAGAYEWR